MRKFYLAGMVCVCLLAGQIQATPINTPIINEATDTPYTLYSMGRLSASKEVQVNGLIGSVGHVRFGKFTSVIEDVYTDGKFRASKFTQIAGHLIAEGNIKLSSSVIVGRIDGGQKLKLGRNATVIGDVTLGIASGLSRHPTATIGGTLLQDGSNETWDAPVFLVNPGFTSDLTKNIKVGKNDEIILEPGTYGKLKLGRNATLILTAGDYDFKNISLGKNSKIILRTETDEETINVKVEKKMSTSTRVEIIKEGPGDSQFRVAGNTKIGKLNTLFTSIVTHNRLSIGHQTELTGFYYSEGNMKLGKNVVVNALSTPSEAVPEPATLALLGLGTLIYIRKRTT